MNFEVIEQEVENAKIKVVGVGGGGGNAVIHMINHNIAGVDFICANTDTQALSATKSAITLKLGNGLTKGLGAGADPDIGSCLLYTSPSPRDLSTSRMPSSA